MSRAVWLPGLHRTWEWKDTPARAGMGAEAQGQVGSHQHGQDMVGGSTVGTMGQRSCGGPQPLPWSFCVSACWGGLSSWMRSNSLPWNLGWTLTCFDD